MNPILLDIPSPLQTRRLLLRTPRAGDGAIVWPTVQRSLPELKLWMPWATDDYNQQGAEEWCRKAAAEFLARKQLQYLIFQNDSGEHLGNIGAFAHNWDVPSCEIGYWLRSDRIGRGFMTEAVGALLQMLREQINVKRTQIRTDAENARSRRVAELAGFQLEGILRCDSLAVGGTLRNTCLYSRIESDR